MEHFDSLLRPIQTLTSHGIFFLKTIQQSFEESKCLEAEYPTEFKIKKSLSDVEIVHQDSG